MDFQDSPIRTGLSVSCVEFVNHIFINRVHFLGKMGGKSLLKKKSILPTKWKIFKKVLY